MKTRTVTQEPWKAHYFPPVIAGDVAVATGNRAVGVPVTVGCLALRGGGGGFDDGVVGMIVDEYHGGGVGVGGVDVDDSAAAAAGVSETGLGCLG